MARKREKKIKKNKKFMHGFKTPSVWHQYHQEIVVVMVAATFLFFGLSIISFNPQDNTLLSFSSDSFNVTNLAGCIGANVAAFMLFLLGSAAYLFLAVLMAAVYFLTLGASDGEKQRRLWWLVVPVVAGSGLCYLYQFDVTQSTPGGWFGFLVGYVLEMLIGYGGALILLWSCTWISCVLVSRLSLACLIIQCCVFVVRSVATGLWYAWCSFESFVLAVLKKIGQLCIALFTWDEQQEKEGQGDLSTNLFVSRWREDHLPTKNDVLQEHHAAAIMRKEEEQHKKIDAIREQKERDAQQAREDELDRYRTINEKFKDKKLKQHGLVNSLFKKNIFAKENDQEESSYMQTMTRVLDEVAEQEKDSYRLPALSLFTINKDHQYREKMGQQALERGKKLTEKLRHFGIKGTICDIKLGPVITMYEYQPKIDSKISRITALEDDLAMALSAYSIRIIAPIPGKNTIGFEIANKNREGVLFSETIASERFQRGDYKLPLAIGVDVLGKPVMHDLTIMPHLLIGGTTGSGKSVGLNCMIASLLCKTKPKDLRLILIDPKRLEFMTYVDIPHLLFPIVTSPRRATLVLKWVTQEMEERYERMAAAGVRNIDEYRDAVKRGKCDKEGNPLVAMPYIAVVIDELADLMIVTSREIEKFIVRIAQMARASGIHMIVATQRPSVDVVTGLIKVNFPSRVAFRVASKVDSRTILDAQGAEKLLGRGDMLFMHSASSHLARIHGAYISDEEVQKLTTHLRNQQKVDYLTLNEVLKKEKGDTDKFVDDMYPAVLEFLKSTDEVSISLLQRRFSIGFNRSARIIEQLEFDGMIAPAQGSKPRKVIK